MAQLLADTVFAATESRRLALLIGINEYASPNIMTLRGAVNDVNMMRRILTTRFGFPEQNIKVLVDNEATRAGILNALDQLVDEAGENDVVYFHYSGHGSRVQDFNGDEPDGMDETIIPHDARQADIRDILDDELDQRFGRLRAQHALIVFDSCNSGTITRSVSPVQPRTIPPDGRLDLYRGTQIQTRQVVEVAQLPHVLMTAAPAELEALDGPLDEGFYGLFSYSLARSMDTNGPAATPRTIHEGARAELQRIREQLYTSPPEPQLEGPPEKLTQPVLPVLAQAERGDDVTISRRAWVLTELLSNDKLRLLDSRSLNSVPGSRWAVYGPDEINFGYGEALAVGMVESLSGNDAVLMLTEKRSVIPSGAKAILIAPPDLSGDLPIQIDGVSELRRTVLARAIAAEQPKARVTEPNEFARFIVEHRAGEWRVMGAGGLNEVQSFPDGDDDAVIEQIIAVLSRVSKSMALMAIDNPASDLGLTVRLHTSHARGADVEDRGLVRVAAEPEAVYRIRRSGATRTPANSLTLEVRADRNVYLTIVSIDTEGSVNQLFPNRHQKPGYMPDGFLPGNTVQRIPDSLSPGNRAGFYWDYNPPVGIDTVRVFASSDLETAKIIQRFIADAGNDVSGLQSLNTKLASKVLRGMKLVADDTVAVASKPPQDGSAWTAASVVIQIRD